VTRRFFRLPGAGEAQLRPDEYRLLRDLVSERLGIWFPPDGRASLERRLRERLVVRGLASYADYVQLLKYSPLAAEEWEEAADLLTTHETYFFREDYQLRAFKHELLPMLAEWGRAKKRLRVWSAGCSTGEEAYTIAILILESGLFDAGDGWDVRIYGSDLSKKCIAAARRGVYSGASFRTVTEATKRAWFAPTPGGGGELGVAPEPRTLCHFGQMNLLDEDRTHLVGRCDVIFCRNVLLYFDAAKRRRVIDMFYDRLVPGGVLLLGHAESLLNVSTAFELLHLQEDLVYRKPLSASGASSR
jgi:chemotaxis protein methyltransferase CheR